MNAKEKTQNKFNKGFIRSMLIIFIMCMIVFQPQDASCINPSYPEIGNEIPDFTLDTISNYESNKVSKSDLKGQYYILDFWNSRCGTCIASFPKVNQLQNKYQSKLQFFLVGVPDNVIEKLYAKLRTKNNLDLATAYSRKLADAFCPYGFPHLIWVDRDGKVIAITTSEDLTAGNIEDFLNDKPFVFDDYSYKGLKSKKFDWSKPYLINNNGGNDTSFMFRTVLSKWKKGMPFFYPPSINSVPDGYYHPAGYQVLKVELVQLYNLAYYGEYYPREDSINYNPVLQIKDTSAFHVNSSTWEGYFCYSVILPKEQYNKENLKKFLRNDLENCFPYDAKVEKRLMPCYILSVIDHNKTKKLFIKNKNDRVSNYMEKEFNNITASQLAKALAYVLPGDFRVFDATKIAEKINIKINALMTDLSEVRVELNKYGLDLLPSEKLMSALVISE